MQISSADPLRTSRGVLDVQERVAEVLFGLIMVLSFTGSLSVADAGRDDIRAMIIGALGCNLAWGLIDGVFYLMGSLADRGRGLSTLRAVRSATDPEAAQRTIAQALPSVVASILEPAELESIQRRLLALPEPPAVARLSGRDLLGALGVFLLVFLSTFPVAIPFLFVSNVMRAMRVSNAVAIVMLLITGALYGKHVGRSQWAFGAAMVFLGGILVTITIALGG